MKCKNCTSNNIEVFFRDVAFEIIKCNDCGLIFKPDIRIQYSKLDESYYGHFNFDRAKEAQEIIRIIKRHTIKSDNLNIVEIGCGTGSLLAALRKHKVNVYGYEPSLVACRMAESQYNLGTIKNEYYTENTFNIVPDVFLLYDVIEHLDDAITLLQSIRKSMNQHSILIIKSGNTSSLNALLYPPKWHYYYIDQHIMFYSKPTLETLASRVGLEVVSYYRFMHAYGGLALKELCKNIIKACIFRLSENKSILRNSGIWLANDHFISVLKLKQNTI